MISLKQMEALYWIASLGTFQRAADKLNTTQSAISKRVLEMETALGFSVFDRSQRRVRLTDSGEELLYIGREMLDLAAKASRLNPDSEIQARKLRLGITELSAMAWLPRFVASVAEDYPSVTIVADVDSARALYDRLLDDALDIVVLPEFFSDSSVVAIRAAEVDNSWVCSPELIEPTKVIDLESLSSHVLLMQSVRSASGSFYSRWLKSEGISFHRNISTDSLVALAGLAVAKLGVAILPPASFAHLFTEGRLTKLLVEPSLPRLPYAVMHRDEGPQTFVGKIAEMILSACSFEDSILSTS